MQDKDYILIDGFKHIRHKQNSFSEGKMLEKSKNLFNNLNKRRSVRDFSNKEIPIEVIENLIKTASTAPSGAN